MNLFLHLGALVGLGTGLGLKFFGGAGGPGAAAGNIGSSLNPPASGGNSGGTTFYPSR